MKTVLSSLALALIAALVAITPAHAEGMTQVCVADPHDPQLIHTPLAIEDGDDTSVLAGMIVRPFPNSVSGCAGHDGVPLQDWETLYPGTHTHTTPLAPTCQPTVVETSSVQTIVDTRRVEQLKRQLRRKDRLIAKLRRELAQR